jgi:Meckel syndrome type 1 protein
VALAAAQLAPAASVGPRAPSASASTTARAPSADASSAQSAAAADPSASHLAAQAVVAPPAASGSAPSDHDNTAGGSDTPGADAATAGPKADANGVQTFTIAGQQAAAGTGAPASSQPLAAHPAPIPDQIAAQLAAKLPSAASSRFDIALDPAGLGRVNVSVQINAAGQVTASLTFDNPHAAAEARSGAGALQHALEQAGFSVAQGGLSFDVGGQGANFSRQDTRPQTAAAAFTAQPEPPVPSLASLSAVYGASRTAAGIDITI